MHLRLAIEGSKMVQQEGTLGADVYLHLLQPEYLLRTDAKLCSAAESEQGAALQLSHQLG